MKTAMGTNKDFGDLHYFSDLGETELEEINLGEKT